MSWYAWTTENPVTNTRVIVIEKAGFDDVVGKLQLACDVLRTIIAYYDADMNIPQHVFREAHRVASKIDTTDISAGANDET